MTLTPGLRAEVEHAVTESDTAQAVGSGDMPVLATPKLLALAEAATVAAISSELPDGQTSVGTQVSIDHVRASPVGSVVRVNAGLIEVDGSALRFEVVATDSTGHVIGRGEVTRAVVDRVQFLAGVFS
jgi:fluoroacetyl-CoA thioesterase